MGKTVSERNFVRNRGLEYDLSQPCHFVSVDFVQGLTWIFFNDGFTTCYEADIYFTLHFSIWKSWDLILLYIHFWSFKAVPLTTFYQSFVIFLNVTITLSNLELLAARMMMIDIPHLKKSQTKQKNSLGNCTPRAWSTTKKLVQSLINIEFQLELVVVLVLKNKMFIIYRRVGWNMGIWQRWLKAFQGLNCSYSINAAALLAYA